MALRICSVYVFDVNTGLDGMQKATGTPAIVECTPELKNKYHTTVPSDK